MTESSGWRRAACLSVAVLLAAACSGEIADVGNENLTGADESVSSELSDSMPIGSAVATTANLNLRSGPGTQYGILQVIPLGGQATTINSAYPINGWYNIKFAGVEGWSHGGYLKLASSPKQPPPGEDPPPSTNPSRDGMLQVAHTGVGFSYWWGHGAWTAASSMSSAGSCAGSCPNCTHNGSFGADCSGYVAKIWAVPSSNNDPSQDGHPFTTYNFYNDATYWQTIDRASLQAADALVYNASGAGHVFLYEAGDGWGSMWAFEARGCSYGIVHNLRTASTAFKAIAKNGL